MNIVSNLDSFRILLCFSGTDLEVLLFTALFVGGFFHLTVVDQVTRRLLIRIMNCLECFDAAILVKAILKLVPLHVGPNVLVDFGSLRELVTNSDSFQGLVVG